VVYDKTKNGVILSFVDGNKARVRIDTQKGGFRTKTILVYKLFTKSKVYKGFRVGDVYTSTIVNNDKVSYKTGRIHAVGLKGFLILPSNENGLRYLEYDN
jgi:hypothetical protein